MATGVAALSSLLSEFVRVCKEAERGAPAAAKWLEAFPGRPGALEVAKAVLDTTTDMAPRFHAINAVCGVVVRQWDATAPAARVGIRNYLLGYSFEKWLALDASVRNKLLQTVCVMWKRGWLTETAADKATFLGQIHGLLQPTSSVTHKLMGIHLVRELLQQFCSTRSSSIRMPLEFHAKCREAFKDDGLRQLWMLAFQVVQAQAASPAMAKVGGMPSQDVELLSVALGVMEECLEWRFDPADGSAALKHHPISPGPQWREALLSDALPTTMFRLYQATRLMIDTQLPHHVRQTLLQVFDTPTNKTAYFARIMSGWLEIERDSLATRFAAMPMDAASFQRAEASAAETLAVCQACFRLVASFGIKVLGALPLAQYTATLQRMAGLSVRLLGDAAKAAKTRVEASKGRYAAASSAMAELAESQQEWNLEGFDHLLDAWITLLLAPEAAGTPSPHIRALHGCCKGIYEAMVQRRLEIATSVVAAGVDDDDPYEDPEVLREHLEASALLGRAQAASSLQLLINLVTAATKQIKDAAAASATAAGEEFSTQVSCLNERLFWLVWFAGHLLADAGEGEAPQIPVEMNAVSTLASRGGKHKFQGNTAVDPVVQLCSAMLELVDVQSRLLQANPHSDLLSPLVGSKLMWFLGRWSYTYLMPNMKLYREMVLSPNLIKCYASSVAAPSVAAAGGIRSMTPHQILDFIIQTTALMLSLWSHEPECVEHALSVLRHLVANRSAASITVHSASWAALCKAEALCVQGVGAPAAEVAALGPLGGVLRLPADSQRRLVSLVVGASKAAGVDTNSLAVGAMGSAGQEAAAFDALSSAAASARQKYFISVAGPVLTKLQSFLAAPMFGKAPYPKEAQAPGVVSEITRIISLCAGAACPDFSVPPDWLMPLALPMLEKCAGLVDGFAARTTVTLACLQFARDLCRQQLPVLSNAPSQRVYKAVAALIAAYSKHKKGATSTEKGAEEELHDNLVTILELLSCLMAKDNLDWGDTNDTGAGAGSGAGASAANAGVGAADVVFYGLQLVVPLMTARFLAFPDLSALYLRVVGEMLELHPERVAKLEPGLLKTLLASLEFGIHQHDAAVQRLSLEALFALARFHATAMTKAKLHPGAVVAASVGLTQQLVAQPDLLMKFCRSVLVLLLGTCPPSSFSAASNALFALIVAQQAQYPTLIEAFVAQQQGASQQARLRAAFAALTTTNSVGMGFDRPNRKRFEDNVTRFVAAVRAFAVIK